LLTVLLNIRVAVQQEWHVMWWLYSFSRNRNTVASNLHSESDVTPEGIRCGREDGTQHR
jgi:hypothetical protein